MLKKSIVIICITFSFTGNSQTLKTIEDIETAHQECLDRGENMNGCSEEYYAKADNLLNTTYKKVKLKLSASEQSILKAEQLKWIKKRDKYFQKVYLDTKREGEFGEGSSGFNMIVTDLQAKFVMDRVKILMKRL
jgi:uncharacterized protein YecT (DUF1311 family)